MRVLHIFKWYGEQCPGGTQKVMEQLITATTPLGVQNSVLCLSDGRQAPGELRGSHGETVRYCAPTCAYDSLSFSLEMFRRFPGLAAEHDLIHYHFPFPQQDLMHLRWAPARASVVSYHSDVVRQRLLYHFYRPLMDTFLSRMDALVAASPQYLATSPVLRKFKKKSLVIPYGLDESTYPEIDEKNMESWRGRVGSNFFLFLGVLRYYKGLHFLLRAAAGARQCRVVIAGSGPLEGELQRQATELGLNNVHFVGAVSERDKVSLLRLSRALVFPSHLRSEAFGISLLEGAMFSRPLISAEIGTGTTYVNQHRETGLVVPPADSEALREAMETLERDPELAAHYGRQARQRYQEHFTAQRCGLNYHALYNVTIQQHPILRRSG